MAQQNHSFEINITKSTEKKPFNVIFTCTQAFNRKKNMIKLNLFKIDHLRVIIYFNNNIARFKIYLI